jgi:hypothetical protein
MQMTKLFRVLGIGFLVLLGTNCVPSPSKPTLTPLLNIPAWNLLLDDHAFPKGWSMETCTLSRHCFGEIEAYRDFGIAGIPGHVIQNVFRMENIEAAKAKFRTYREVDFRPRQPPNHQFLPPPEITYHSLLADEYYLGCGVDEVPACRAIFRYSNYFVYFYFDIDGGKGDGLKIREVEPILRAMDERAAAVLGLRLRAEPTKTP